MAWVRGFFARYPGRRRRDIGRTEIEIFLADIAQRAGVSNWQVQQARDAMELYYEQFRGIALAPRHDATEPKRTLEPPAPPTPKPVAELRNRQDVPAPYTLGRRDVKGKHGPLAMEPGAAVGPAPPALQTAEVPPSTGASAAKTLTIGEHLIRFPVSRCSGIRRPGSSTARERTDKVTVGIPS